jgi:hypothetical protein
MAKGRNYKLHRSFMEETFRVGKQSVVFFGVSTKVPAFHQLQADFLNPSDTGSKQES